MARAFFWDQSWLEQTPRTGFFHFFLFKKYIFVNICIYLDFWGVKAALCKIWEILGQIPRRNNLSKLTTFDPVFQLPHSAMINNSIFWKTWLLSSFNTFRKRVIKTINNNSRTWFGWKINVIYSPSHYIYILSKWKMKPNI